MKVLITGSNGLLGQKLLVRLVDDGTTEVLATSRRENRVVQTGGYEYNAVDLLNKKDIIDIVNRFQPDVVINTAAMTDVDWCELNREACWKANVDTVKYLIETCESTGSFLLHLSTDFIFDGSDGPVTEEEAPSPVNYYGESKLASEQLLQRSKIDWSVARTVLVYGIVPNMSRNNIILWVKESLENNKSIQVVDDQWRTPTLAEDLAQGCHLIAQKRAKGIFNISGKDFLTPYEMANRVADYFHLDKALINRATAKTFTQPAMRPAKTGFILEKAKSILGYSPHSFDGGIAIVAKQLNEL